MKMGRKWASGLLVVAVSGALAGPIGSSAAQAGVAADCSSGAHTLSAYGEQIYPEMGNGGYRSVHTDVHMVYDAATNMFLSGHHVDLTDLATQCLTDFSLDFERSSTDVTAGPNLSLGSVTVNGAPATFKFVQPTYAGDPNGQDDPDPNAHLVSQTNPVGGPNNVQLPPACSPQVSGTSANGTQCPANKLVITPSTPIPNGSTFVVSIAYTGRPGVHHDGDGSTEGWFRSNTPVGDGAFVTTEPIGTMAWMPLNNHPSAKPTYDFYDTVNAGKTAIANGVLVSNQSNAPDANFPAGSTTWHWHSPEGVASYLVENSIGSFDMTHQIINGIDFYQAQASSISASQKATNKTNMDTQPDMTQFQSMFAGPYPFTSAGIIIGLPSASFEEEMQTKITFQGGKLSSLSTLAHENFHQWFGDNVSEASIRETFWKEGWATIGEYLYAARNSANTAGGLGTAAGDAAFNASLASRFNTNYGTTSSTFWTVAPSKPTVSNLFSTANTYTRPGTAYLALRQILDGSVTRMSTDRWVGAMKQIQSQYGGGVINTQQLENVFHQWLPNQSAACHAKLDTFFTQWFDTAYPTPNNATNKPQITGPGINGPDHFYDDNGPCTRASQSITLSSLPNTVTAAPDQTVTAVADSGLPVTLAASGECALNGSSLHLTGAGTCTVTATQAGDGVYQPATASRTFAINIGGYVQIVADVAAGTLSLSLPAGSTVTLPAVTLTGYDQISVGSLNPLTVTDARGTAAGWSLTGQVSDFIGPAGLILADNLGWAPSASATTGALPTPPGTATSVSPGATAAPGTGLGNARQMCSSPSGSSAGAFNCGATLSLGVPGSTKAGTYTGVLTLTLV